LLNNKNSDPDPRKQSIVELPDPDPQQWLLVLTFFFDKDPGRAI
jgi:hypothetical protein